MIDTSIVVSAFNEEENLEELYSELTRVMEAIGATYEIIFTDDGSTDRTFELLRKFHVSDGRVRVVRFGRNFGQQAANAVGLRLARGETVILIDADLQTPPTEIPKLRDKLLEGYDLVYGMRPPRPGPFYRRIGTVLANWFIRKVTGANVPDAATSFLAINRKLVDEVNLFNDKTRYLCGYLAWLSYGRHASVPVKQVPRKHGRSKYTLWRLIELTITLVTHYTNAPLALATYLGAALILGGTGLLAWGLAGVGNVYAGAAAAVTVPVIGALVLLSGVQLVCIGVVGEYVGRTYNETRNRPSYLIREILDHTVDDSARQADASPSEDRLV
jgi:glycosyltransferase involved in cell wall biosynthesis